MNQHVFHTLLKTILESPRELIAAGSAIAVLAQVIAHMSKVAFKRDIIKPSSSTYNAKLRDTNNNHYDFALQGMFILYNLLIADIKSILNFLYTVPPGPWCYTVKNHMLVCLRHLMKCEEVFTFIKAEPDLYVK